jgi:hypothetical protein
MQDETASNTSSRGMTRRSLLAAAGVSAIAGCSSIDSPTSGNDPTIRTVELPDVDAGSVPEPVVAPSVPVDVDPAYFVGRRDRINELLASLPIPLGPDDVPNGHVRDHLTDAADTATNGLDAALADSPNADLARTVLSDVSWRVSNADQELDRYRRRAEVSATNLDDIMEEYIITAAIARATPDACQQTANPFDAV